MIQQPPSLPFNPQPVAPGVACSCLSSGPFSGKPQRFCQNLYPWMLFPFGWSRHGDWPDLAASRAPSPLLVQYNLQDDLFTEDGMRAAHVRLQTHYANQPDSYTGQFYPGPHKFDLEMQIAAFDWLKKQLR